MAEFKISEALSQEVSAVGETGKAINEGYQALTSEDVDTLITSKRTVEQHNSIKELLDLYKVLVEKDVNDFVSMINEAKKVDETIAGSNKF